MTPFVIAEVGSNWLNLEDCIQSIQMAKACGADAVKFQLFTHEELYGYGKNDGSLKELPRDWIPLLKDKSDAAKIEFICTAFSPEGVDFIDPFVCRHKIASPENNYTDLLDKIASKGKPILLSCGGSSLSDIRRSLEHLESRMDEGKPNRMLDITLMYCITSYPAYETDLFKLEKLKMFKKPVGFSDHSLDVINAPLLAAKVFGATIIEKHFKLEHLRNTSDAPHSLDPASFAIMVNHIKGEKELPYRSREEMQAVLKYKRRLLAIKDVPHGTILKYGENYGAYRSLKEDTKGIMPFMWKEYEGKPITVDLKAGDPIFSNIIKEKNV